jgi:large subunit ribosomal protein L21
MEAVIVAGGKQYRVSPGQVISVERLPAAGRGTPVEFTSVLLVNRDGAVSTSTDELQRAKVSGEIVSDGKGPKIRVLKFKRRKNYRRNRGHRQAVTRIRITGIDI